MGRCAILTTDDLDGFVTDDALVAEPLAARGWDAEWVPWRRPDVAWDDYDVVVIRTPWDYQQDPDAFRDCLAGVEASRARLRNRLDVVRWNMNKTYLMHLPGVPVVPTLFVDRHREAALVGAYHLFKTDEVVIKPQVGANADHTHRLPRSMSVDERRELLREVGNRPVMFQPFVPAIQDEGEISMIYIGGAFSHAVHKQPRAGDFRSQEEHGAHVRRVDPAPDLLEAADRALAAAPPDLLYARVDLVRFQDRWRLMELELIEPSLYLRLDPDAPARLAAAIEATRRAVA